VPHHVAISEPLLSAYISTPCKVRIGVVIRGDDGDMSTAMNRERLPAGFEGREIVHPDGSLTRVARGAITTLAANPNPVADDGSSGVVRLSQGALWHQPAAGAPAGQVFVVEVGSARIITEDATFALILEADGSCFLTSVAGTISVHGRGSPVVVAPLQAAVLSPTGELVDTVQATPDEVRSDPWVGSNLSLSEVQPDAAPVLVPVPAAMPDPSTEVAEARPEGEPRPEGEDEPDTGTETVLATEPGAEAEVEAEAEEPDADGSAGTRIRAVVAAVLVIIGIVIAVIAIHGVASSNKGSSGLESTDSTTASGRGATSAPATSSAVASRSAAAPTSTPPTSAGGTTTGGAPALSTPPSTVAQVASHFSVHPTRCAQTGSQLSAEGNLTNLDPTAHNYRVTVVFTIKDSHGATMPAASVTADVADATPNQLVTWQATTTYGSDLTASQGGCKVGSVQIVGG
jgi:hypothetical protein